jgi:alanyl-tRNA synthetase
MTGNELRTKFLEYFAQNGHKIVASGSLVPHQDPTLLFTNAGMNQFKRIFTGEEKRDYNRATTSQKCVRAGGKHNDLENVGHTARHHTFFEMLGNFSFGDYFKKEAIEFAWNFLVHEVKLDTSRLRATVFKGEQGVPGDEEAFQLWKQIAGLPDERIHRLGMKDNFWSMGDTGPCGPCSEVHYHQGDHLPCVEEKAGRHCLGVECECDRWLEIWNLVFMQFNRKEAGGAYDPLPKPSIDTGMGLERLASVVQGKLSNYDTDLFQPLIRYTADLGKTKYGASEEHDTALRVIADHGRAMTFLIGDGVLPSNEGRGYVLRRIMRRAARYGRKLGIKEPFLYKVSGEVVDQMSGAYPDLIDNSNYIARVIKAEEERFNETLDKGMVVFEEAIRTLTKTGGKILGGDVLFRLYDTFGFPVDLTRIMAEEQGYGVDEAGFETAMEEQRNRARSAWKGSGDEGVKSVVTDIFNEVGPTAFVGYDTMEADGSIRKILLGDRTVKEAGPSSEVEIVFNVTPFYGASGGQVGDKGVLEFAGARVRITDTKKPLPHLVLHHGIVESGTIKEGATAHLKVDADSRNATRRNHTATHLLHAALRKVLGDHVKQAGSLVSPDRLRFDFAHFSALEPREIQAVEDIVNEQILINTKVELEVLNYAEAVKSGATALFGEKYEDEVRVISVPSFSKELCGGTHVSRTGDIGLFLISSEAGIAAGVRRIEAVTGTGAIAYIRERAAKLAEAATILKSSPDEVPLRLHKTLEGVKELEREIQRLKQKLAGGASTDLMSKLQDVNGIKLLAVESDARDPKELRETYDQLKQRLPSGVIALGARSEDKVFLLVGVSADLTSKLKAGQIVKEMAAIVGGSGGGKPDLAQAGGTIPEKLPEALAAAESILSKIPS